MNSLLTAKEAGTLLNVHPKTVYLWARQGRLPASYINGRPRFRQSELDEFIKKGRVNSPLEHSPGPEVSLDSYDRMHLKGGKSALSKNSRRWNYGFGSVYLRKTRQGRDRWYIDYPDGQGRRQRQVIRDAQTRGEALIALQGRVREIFDGKHHPRRSTEHLTFNQLADRFIREYSIRTKRSWKTDEWRLVAIREHLGNMGLAQITASEILEYRQARLKAGRSELTANREIALLKTMFGFACENGLMSENPARRVKMFSEKDTARARTLSLDEELRLLPALSPELRSLVVVALHTGLRLGEVLGLCWCDVNLEKKTVRVEHTKSKKARFIPVNSVLHAELGMLRGTSGNQSLVFPFKRRSVRTGFENACKGAAILDFTFHDLRRTFGTRLLEKGVDIVTISRLYGHSSVLVTQNYLHPADELSREAVEFLAEGHGEKAQERENLAQICHTEKENPPWLPVMRLFSVK
jgi:excisionase family DNA binding protein